MKQAQEIYLLIGPDDPCLQGHYLQLIEQADDKITIHGNGIIDLDYEHPQVTAESRVIINTHGMIQEDKLILQLQREALVSAEYFFNQLKKTTNDKFLDVEVMSCHSGAAVSSSHYLAKGSTVIAFTNKDDVDTSHIFIKLITESAKFNMPNNVFARFLSYILINPGDLSFTLVDEPGVQLFQTNTQTIKDFSVTGIKAWQEQQISRFISRIEKTTYRETERIEFLNFVKNEAKLTSYFDSFDINKYQISILLSLQPKLQQEGIFEKVENLLANIHEINAPITQNGETIFSLLEREVNPSFLFSLIAAGADPNIVNRFHRSTFSASTIHGLSHNIKYLLAAGADPDLVDREGKAALQLAHEYGHHEIAEEIKSFKANKLAYVLKYNIGNPKALAKTIITLAKQQNTPDQIKDIIIFLNDKFSTDVTYLQAAIESKGIRIDYNAILKLAIDEENVDICNCILTRTNIDIDQVDEQGRTYLFMAASKGSLDIATILIQKGATIDKATIAKSNTALHIAAQNNHLDMVKYLILSGADINKLTKGGNSALTIATKKGNINLLKFLLSHGADASLINLEEITSEDIKTEIISFQNDPSAYIEAHKLETSTEEELIAAPPIESAIPSSSLLALNRPESGNTKRLVSQSEPEPKSNFLSSELESYAGFFLGKLIITPVFDLASDTIAKENRDKTISSYWIEQISLNSLGSFAVASTAAVIANKFNIHTINRDVGMQLGNDLIAGKLSASTEYSKFFIKMTTIASVSYGMNYIITLPNNKFVNGVKTAIVPSIAKLIVAIGSSMFEKTMDDLATLKSFADEFLSDSNASIENDIFMAGEIIHDAL